MRKLFLAVFHSNDDRNPYLSDSDCFKILTIRRDVISLSKGSFRLKTPDFDEIASLRIASFFRPYFARSKLPADR